MNRVFFIQKFIIIAGRIKNITTLNIVDRHTSNKVSAVTVFLITGLTILFISCGQMGKTGTNETATRGSIKITAANHFSQL